MMQDVARWLGRLLGRSPEARALFVHEDDWGQIEVLPAACADWCAYELARIAQFAAAHATPDEVSWTEMYVRPGAPLTLAALNIPFDATVAAIGRRLEPFEVVTSGTFSSPQPVPGLRAFGPGPRAAIILAPDRDAARVDTISLVLDAAPADCARVIAVLAALPTPAPLLLVDWLRGRQHHLDDADTAFIRY